MSTKDVILIYIYADHQPSIYFAWEIRFVLLLWLSNLALIPFDIFSMDSSRGECRSEINALNASSLVENIFSICGNHLEDSGPTRDAAAICLASLLTRPDMDKRLLGEFMDQTCKFILVWAAKSDSEVSDLSGQYFRLLGYLHCIALVFKKGHRENLLVFSCETLQTCLKLTTQANQTIVRKMYTKIFQRIGMALLPPKIASWRYQRGFRSLQLNLTGVLALASDGSSESTTECEIDDCNVVVPELEDIIDMLLVSLKDRDTIVRWSAAKGIGRMCMRLSKEHADEVVEAVLSNFQDPDDDGAWHGIINCIFIVTTTFTKNIFIIYTRGVSCTSRIVTSGVIVTGKIGSSCAHYS